VTEQDCPWLSLSSGELTARINPMGAQLSVLRDAQERDLLWNGDPAIWTGRAPILFPIVGALGFCGIFAILIFVLLTHDIGRIAGPSWVIIGLCGYLIYRRNKGLPVFRSRKIDWQTQQVAILRDAGELEMMDEYIARIRAKSPK